MIFPISLTPFLTKDIKMMQEEKKQSLLQPKKQKRKKKLKGLRVLYLRKRAGGVESGAGTGRRRTRKKKRGGRSVSEAHRQRH